MRNANDKPTANASKRARGRPRTSNAEKRRSDTAERARRFRARQKLKRLAMEKAALASSYEAVLWLDFFRHLSGDKTTSQYVTISYCDGKANMRGDMTWPQVEALFTDPAVTSIELD
ncbi:hypothetical protein [Marinimicrobium sp. ABcell2]|uniref:hypothetical protein n=1 Tax=Marinimicrobium sp. ABcell2 TaxID=3069751 RepID=UPI0027AE093C|nr:hypothetical protein [Marinimicrobium sp. ABcell2]MDQ2077369.1 hypothetical protein [Marinimicrobium sp. ABcell2]